MERELGSSQDRMRMRARRHVAFAAALLILVEGSVGACVGTPKGFESAWSWVSIGITRERAIEIATGVSAVNGSISPVAYSGFDTSRFRFVWRVSWAYSAGPTSGEYCDVMVDYFTGEILDRSCVYS